MDSPEFKEYSRRASENGEAHGGIILQKYIIKENLGQGETPNFIFVVEYPSYEIAVDTFRQGGSDKGGQVSY